MFWKIKKKFRNLSTYITREYYKYKYYSPNSTRPSVPLSNLGEKIFEGLENNGVVKVEKDFTKEAEYIENIYFSLAERKIFPDALDQVPIMKDINTPYWLENGRPIAYYISFRDENLESIFLNNDIVSAVYNYYKRQPYYRSQPVIAKHQWHGTSEKLYQSGFHVDGALKQVSIMFLVNDLTSADTHMEYAIGSHKIEKSKYKFDPDEVLGKYEMFPLIGEKGTMFIFDAGTGLHRAIYIKNSIRKILHIIFTGGDRIFQERFDRTDDWQALKKTDPVVQNSFGKIGYKKETFNTQN